MLLRAFGAELDLTPAAEGMGGAIAKAQALVDEHPDVYFMPRQFDNEANPQVHRETTAERNLARHRWPSGYFRFRRGYRQRVTGVGEVLKSRKPGVEIVAVEPEASPVLSGGEKRAAPDSGHRRGLCAHGAEHENLRQHHQSAQ